MSVIWRRRTSLRSTTCLQATITTCSTYGSLLQKEFGAPIPAKVEPRRAGDPAQLIASSEKAKSVLGWKPQYDDLRTIIQTAWDWHRSHPHGYEK